MGRFLEAYSCLSTDSLCKHKALTEPVRHRLFMCKQYNVYFWGCWLSLLVSPGEPFWGFYRKEPENIKHITTYTALNKLQKCLVFLFNSLWNLLCFLFPKQKLICVAMSKYIKGLYDVERNTFLYDKYMPALGVPIDHITSKGLSLHLRA